MNREFNPEVQKHDQIEEKIKKFYEIFDYKKRLNRYYREPPTLILSSVDKPFIEEDESKVPYQTIDQHQEISSLFEMASVISSKLEEFGLTFDLSRFAKDLMTKSEEDNKSEKPIIRYDFIEARKFIIFLKNLREKDLEDKTGPGLRIGIRSALSDVLNSLSLQLETEYNFNNPDNRVIELLGHSQDIITQYKRLGLDWDYEKEIEKFQSYTEQARRGSLLEFLAISKLAGFREEEWTDKLHDYTSFDEYSHYWEKLNDTLRESLRNENALPIVQKAISIQINNLQSAISIMGKEIKNLDSQKKLEISMQQKIDIARKYLIEFEELYSKIK